jgi:putative ABC transport system permease protein
LARSPGFTVVAVLTLALGIGANTAIFSIVHAVLLRDLPFRDPDRLVWVWSVRPERNDAPFSLPEYMDYRDQNRSLQHLAAIASWSVSLTGRGDAERFQGTRISANVFELLGVQAALGRTLLPSDDDPGAPRVVVLSHALWQRRFGADPALVGQKLILNGDSHEVVGVLPPALPLLLPGADLVGPLSPESDPRRHIRNSVNFLRFVGRLKPGVSREQAEAELTSIGAGLREQFPVEYASKQAVRLQLLHEQMTGGYRLGLLVLLGAVGLVLLIAAANLANLLHVRATVRLREFAIRAALGASRVRLARQLLTESLILVGIGGVLGVLLALWGVDLLVWFSPPDLPRLGEVGIDSSVLAYALGLSLGVGGVFGLASVFGALRSSLSDELKGEGRGGQPGLHRQRARRFLVTAEIAMAVLLLASAGLLMKSLLRLRQIEPGFNAENVLVARLSFPTDSYDTLEAFTNFSEQLERRLTSLPGVEDAGAISIVPLASGMIGRVPFTIEGRPLPREEIPLAEWRLVTPTYRRVMQVPLVQGRDISKQDNAQTPPVALINETLAERFFPNENPVGARLLLDDNDTGPRSVEVVGVVGDVRQSTLESQPTFDIYIALHQAHKDGFPWLRNNQFWVVRTSGDPLALSEAFRRELRSLDPDVPASDLRSMEQYLAFSLAPRRFNLHLMAIFAASALLLAFLGVYGVVAYSVSQRSREIGLRLALGARRADIYKLILGQGLRLVLAGLGVGLGGTLVSTRLLSGLLFGVTPTDPQTFAGVPLLLAAVTLLACYLPARRAARVDPMVALRYE